MRSSTLLSALFIVGTLSSPIVQKRDYVIDWETVTVVEYVNEVLGENSATTTTSRGGQFYQVPAKTPTSSLPPASSESAAPAASPESSPAAAPAPAPVQQGPAGNDFKSLALYHHNVHRANHSADALVWDETLASYAQQVAASCDFTHRTEIDGASFGQNFAGSSSPNRIAGAISSNWYNSEFGLFKNQYGQNSPGGSFHDWGHFTQVLWKSTKSLGCYTQSCPNGITNAPGDGRDTTFMTVCNYDPAGNMGGQYANNVGRPLGNAVVDASPY